MVSGGGENLVDGAYRALFDANPRPMWVYEQETLAFVAVNDAACALYGWSREELLSMQVVDLRVGDELARFERFVQELRRPADGTSSWARDLRHATKTGAVLQVDVEITPLPFQGRPAGLARVTDVTGAAVGRHRFRRLVELSADGITITNPETAALEYVSPGAARILGFTPEELTGAYAGKNTHPDDAGTAKPPGRGESVVTTARHRHADGTWRWLESATTNLVHEPAVRGLVTNFRDVTERKESERAVLEAQRRLEYMLSATAAVMYTSRAWGDFGATFLSANVKNITGYEAREFLASPTFWHDHIHPDDRKVFDDALHHLLEVGEHSFQYRFRHADGRFRWMLDAPRLARSEEGNPREIVGYWVDVTDRVQAEHALQRSEGNFRTVIERAPSAIFVQRAGRIVYANPATVAMLGYENASEIVGREALEFVHPDHHDLIRVRMARTVCQGTSPVVEVRMLRRDRSVVVMEAEAVLLDFDGEASNVVLARDVTERREMFARIAVADRMLSVGTLAAGVAHEVNNPLAYVMSNLAVLAGELPALLGGKEGGRLTRDDVEGLLRDSQEGAARVSGIVRDLRALSRADDHTHGPVDVAAVLKSSLKMAYNEIRHRARVVMQVDENLPPVHANASRLGQVFLNLLVNAAQAIHDGRAESNEIRIRARASDDGRHVLLEIEDTGTGISPSVVGRIFDPFFTTKPIGIGTGLGLSISHQIVQSVGGEISVTSTPGKGSCFHVTFPIAPPGLTRAEIDAAASRSQGPVRRVLMVDDEPALGRSTRLLLLPDHDVVPVTRAREALARLAAGERFDVILCDLMMPEMSGIEFHEQLTRNAPDYVSRVVYITGGAFTDEARAFLGAKGRASVEKPFTEEALRRAIDAIR